MSSLQNYLQQQQPCDLKFENTQSKTKEMQILNTLKYLQYTSVKYIHDTYVHVCRVQGDYMVLYNVRKRVLKNVTRKK